MTQRKIVVLKVVVWLACLEPALLLLYKRSNDVGAKKLIIENLGERREFESLATLAKDEASPELRQAAIKQLELKKSSDTKDR